MAERSGGPGKGAAPSQPGRSGAGAARKREREARLAAALRDNLRRRKEALEGRADEPAPKQKTRKD